MVRELESRVAAVDATWLDLRTIYSSALATVDQRKPAQIIESIAAQGQVVSQSLVRSQELRACDSDSESA